MPSEQPPTRVDCPFCDYEGPSEVLYRGRFDYIIEPLNPVTPGHLLIIPHAHVSDFADVGTISGEAIRTAAWWVSTKDRDGDYNLITSKGEAASQTVGHLHFHLIPRREGDGLALPWSEPAPPSEQPREGKRVQEAERLLRRAYADTHPEEVPLDVLKWLNPEPTPPRGEGDDLAEQLERRAEQWWKLAEDRPHETVLRARGNEAHNAARLARASTHPEQSAQVEAMEKALLWYADPDHWLDGQAGEWIVEEGNHVSGDGFAHNEFEHDNGERARAALEPAPEGEGDESWGCEGCRSLVCCEDGCQGYYAGSGEAALRAADELADLAINLCTTEELGEAERLARAYRSARATSTKESNADAG